MRNNEELHLCKEPPSFGVGEERDFRFVFSGRVQSQVQTENFLRQVEREYKINLMKKKHKRWKRTGPFIERKGNTCYRRESLLRFLRDINI
jgi:hypothetical protein